MTGWVGLTVVAFVLRVSMCALTFDVPGDGPSRAIAVWEWLQNPHVVTWGFWPPGPLYLAAVVGLVQPDPLWSVRILNVVAGTATVPVLYWVSLRVTTPAAAWLAAALLAVLPLHVEVSTSSLAEATFVFEMLVGLLVVMAARDATRWQWAAGLAALLWATMTRYEAWWFAPAVIGAVACTRRWGYALGTALAMLAFPLVWTVGNLLAVGEPFYGFRLARMGAEIAGTPPVGLAAAMQLVATIVREEMGWLLALGVVAGLGMGVARARRLPSWDRIVFAGAVATFWVPMIWFALQRGESLLDRYLLFGIVLLLPIAATPWAAWCGRRPGGLVAVGVLLAVAVVGPRFDRWPPAVTWLTWSEPRDVRDFTRWLRASSYREVPLVFTEIGWESSYFALYWPEAAARRMILSPWTTDYELTQFLRRQPRLLVTMPDDAPLQRRIEGAPGAPRIGTTPLAVFGRLEVRPLEAAVEMP